jgi:Vacuolar protein sorting-associated protein 62
VSTEQEIAEKHAPILHLHPDEKYSPMDPETFLRSSRLWRVRDNRVVSAFDVPAKAWVETPERDRLFGLPVELLFGWEALHGPDDASWSRRPHDPTRAADGEQFALEHREVRPTAPFDPDRPPPCYYFVQSWKGSTLVSYWFFYGFSEFLGGIAHQGDWEHVSLVVRGDGTVGNGFFAVHEGKYFVEARDLSFRDGRLQTYSARGRHATWWKTGNHMIGLTFLQERDKIANLQPEAFLQDETAAGAAWDLRRNLRPLAEQPWRLFGGAWGKLGDAAPGTGPLGPWFKRLINPNEKVVLE